MFKLSNEFSCLRSIYENSGRSREGAQGPHPIFMVKKQRCGQYNGNAVSESLLVYAYAHISGQPRRGGDLRVTTGEPTGLVMVLQLKSAPETGALECF